MTGTFTREEDLRNDLDNLHFIVKHKISLLEKLEAHGMTHTPEFKKIETDVNILKKNIKRVEEELERIEAEWIDKKMEELDAQDILEFW